LTKRLIPLSATLLCDIKYLSRVSVTHYISLRRFRVFLDAVFVSRMA